MKDRYVIFGQTGAHFIKGEYQPKDGESFLKNPIKLPKYPLHYWKLVDNQIVEMNDEEKHISDQLISQKKIEPIQQIPIDFDKKIEDKITSALQKLPQPERINIQDILKKIPVPEKINIKEVLAETILPLDERLHKIIEEIDLHFQKHLDLEQDSETLKKYLNDARNKLNSDIDRIEKQFTLDLGDLKLTGKEDINLLEQKLKEYQKYICSRNQKHLLLFKDIYCNFKNIENRLFKFNNTQILTIIGLSSTIAIIICAISRFL